MNAHIRTALAAALVLGIAAGPAVPALAAAPVPASAGHGAPSGVTPEDAPAGNSAYDAPDSEALRAAVSGLPDDGATAALVRLSGTQGSWRGSSGVHDLRTGRPADPAGRFRAGSVTKVFTAAAVLQLAAEKKVDLDQAARHYLPEVIPAAYGKVTVRQLLNHTSGLPSPDFPGTTAEDYYAHRFLEFSARGMVASATAKKELFPAGTRQHYSNIGYTLAGLLIEKVTGSGYEREVTRRIMEPLGLRDSYLPGTDPRIHGPHNHGYQILRQDDGTSVLRDVSVWSPTDGWAAGDLVSTTADLERFTRALFGGQVVRGPLLDEMFTLPPVPDFGTGAPAAYSVGLTSWRLGGRQVWGKSGGRWGYNSGIGGTRDLARTLVYSVNSTDAKGRGTNDVVMNLIVTAFGAPDRG